MKGKEVSRLTLAGYRDRTTVRPGDTIKFMVSSLDEEPYAADLVRIVSGNRLSVHGLMDIHHIGSSFEGTYPGRRQIVQCGSWVSFNSPELATKDWTFACAVMPSLSGRDSMTLFVARIGAKRLILEIDSDSRFRARIEGEEQEWRLERPLPLKCWSLVGLAYQPGTQQISIFQRCGNTIDSETFTDQSLPSAGMCPESLAARRNLAPGGPNTLCHLNGRMDSPRLLHGFLNSEQAFARVMSDGLPGEAAIAWWDFSKKMSGNTLVDCSPNHCDGLIKNLPTRAVRGVRWNSAEYCWRHAPHHYSAAHFHEYDLYDAEWQADFEWTVAADLPSGVYAARLRKDDEVFYVVFFVLPGENAERKDVAFLIPTATYLAYANERLTVPLGELLGMDPPLLAEERMLLDNPEFGLSLYDHHVDGSGVHFSSYLRPTVNWQPGQRVWGLTADTDILRWLSHTETEFDLLTDEAIHADGEELLKNYRVLVTGTHPEYYSDLMRRSVLSFTENGGRLLYMGGNGFYWKVGYSSEWPAAIELRRADDATGAWQSEPGEYFHQSDGVMGGLWRNHGNAAPQQLVGVGFAAQGDGSKLRFRKTKAAYDPRVSFVFEGVDGEIIADYGKMNMTGIGAEEIDRAAIDLGTPGHAIVLASTEGNTAGMLRAKEELLLNLPQIPDPDVRADVTFFETEGGGAVFSIGSIGWASVLAHNDYKNSAARISTNVLQRFEDPAAFECPSRAPTSKELNPETYDHPPGMRAEKLSWRSLLHTALARAAMIAGFSILAKYKGLPKLPVPPLRDEVLLRKVEN